MPLLLSVPTERVPLSTPGEWVDLKSRLSKGEQSKIQAAAFRVQASMNALTTTPNLDLGLDYEATVFAGLEVGIVAWSFAEPVTPVNIRALAPEDYDLLSARANELWSPRKEEDRKNLSASGQASPSTEDAVPPSLAG